MYESEVSSKPKQRGSWKEYVFNLDRWSLYSQKFFIAIKVTFEKAKKQLNETGV